MKVYVFIEHNDIIYEIILLLKRNLFRGIKWKFQHFFHDSNIIILSGNFFNVFNTFYNLKFYSISHYYKVMFKKWKYIKTLNVDFSFLIIK